LFSEIFLACSKRINEREIMTERNEDNASRLFKQQLNEIFEEKQNDDDLINSNDTM